MAKMHSFLRNNRLDLIDRCQVKVASRSERAATPDQLKFGVPLFLDQLVQTLELELTDTPQESRKVSGPSNGGAGLSDVGISAAHHGRQFSELGFTVDQVVHDYGDLCQAITDLAYERDAPFTVDEFRTLNRCLDNAISEAVTEFSFQRDLSLLAKRDNDERDRHGLFVDELRNHLNTASLAFAAARAGNLHLSGATGSVLERSIASLKHILDEPSAIPAEASLSAANVERLSVADFVVELQTAAEPNIGLKNCTFTVSSVAPDLAIEVNRELLLAAVGKLLQNAFRFTKPGTEVILNAYALADHVLIDVKDHCGGLPAGAAEQMFLPMLQLEEDGSGQGLGLSTARRSVAASGGVLNVRDIPGEGCVFTVSLPRHLMPQGVV